MKAVINVKMHGNMFKGQILVPNMDHCLQLHLINGNIKIFVNIDPDPPFPLIRGFQIPKINWLIMNNQSMQFFAGKSNKIPINVWDENWTHKDIHSRF